MKFNSKYIGILSLFLVLAIIISSASAAGLAKSDLGNDNFAIDLPSECDFTEEATTNLNVGDISMNMQVFENKGNNAKDLSAIVYLKDSSSNQNIISDAINDLRKDGAIVEENDKYFVVETKNSNNWDFLNFDIGNDLDSLWSFANGLFSSDNDISLSSQDADVQISTADGINVDAENSSVSISDKGLDILDENGEHVSISPDGIKVTDGAGGDASSNGNVSIDADMVSNIDNADYAVCIKSPKNDQVIIISGNNLDVLKSVAETASFK